MQSSKPPLLVSFKTPLEGLLLGVLMTVASLNKFENEALTMIGTMAITVLLILGIFLSFGYVLRRGGIPRSLLALISFGLIATIMYGFGLARRMDLEGARNLGLVFLVVVYLFTISTIKWNTKEFKSLLIPFSFLGVLNFLSFLAPSPDADATFLGNTNYLGALALFSSVFTWMYLGSASAASATVQRWLPRLKLVHLPYYLLLLLQLITIFLSRSRGVWLTLIVTLITYIFWNRISKYKFGHFIYLAILIGISVSIIYVTVTFPLVSLADGINDMSGKNIESGRERIWPMLLELIAQRPWLGYGAGALPSNLTTLELSSHNYYIQILLQVGTLGLMSIGLLLAEVWNLFLRSRHSLTTRIAGSFFAGMVIHQNFEVSLTQNNMALGATGFHDFWDWD
jgi:O-antigen ligase